MLQKVKQRNEGFTIIEVLIVLAIAGLILMIVFLAVPNLQRNSRNTSIKNDAANMLAAVNEYSSSNDGALPDRADKTGTAVVFNNTAQNGTTAQGNVQSSTTVSIGTTAPTTLSNIVLVKGKKCSGTAASVDSPRSVAALYLIETGSNATGLQCKDS